LEEYSDIALSTAAAMLQAILLSPRPGRLLTKLNKTTKQREAFDSNRESARRSALVCE
jgi:hypothetical protein